MQLLTHSVIYTIYRLNKYRLSNTLKKKIKLFIITITRPLNILKRDLFISLIGITK